MSHAPITSKACLRVGSSRIYTPETRHVSINTRYQVLNSIAVPDTPRLLLNDEGCLTRDASCSPGVAVCWRVSKPSVKGWTETEGAAMLDTELSQTRKLRLGERRLNVLILLKVILRYDVIAGEIETSYRRARMPPVLSVLPLAHSWPTRLPVQHSSSNVQLSTFGHTCTLLLDLHKIWCCMPRASSRSMLLTFHLILNSQRRYILWSIYGIWYMVYGSACINNRGLYIPRLGISRGSILPRWKNAFHHVEPSLPRAAVRRDRVGFVAVLPLLYRVFFILFFW